MSCITPKPELGFLSISALRDAAYFVGKVHPVLLAGQKMVYSLTVPVSQISVTSLAR